MLQWKVSCSDLAPLVGASLSCTYSVEHMGGAELDALQLGVEWSSGLTYLRHTGENYEPTDAKWLFPETLKKGDFQTLTVNYNATQGGVQTTELSALVSVQSIQLTTASKFTESITER